MTRIKNYALVGFVFGSVGLYLLAILSLISPVFEMIAAPLLWPGRALARVFAGPEGSTGEVLLLTLANGALYAALAAVIGFMRERLHADPVDEK